MPAPPPIVTIIDDDESVRRALRRLIKSIGLNVEAFATAEEFLEGFTPDSQDRYHEPGTTRCLILDVHLPGLSGLELQERLKVETRELPVIFMTAYEDARKQERALQMGAVAFLYKPFEQQTLLEALQKGIARTRAAVG